MQGILEEYVVMTVGRKTRRTSRRMFLKRTVIGATAVALGPTILGAQDKSGRKTPTVGAGEHTYECFHGWGELPSHITWGETHGVTIDEAGLIYIKHRNNAADPMDAIAVFDAAGK